MPSIGTITSQAKTKTGLPWPTTQTSSGYSATNPISGIPTPYAGPAPISTPAQPQAPTTTPTTVATALGNTTNTVDQAKAAINSTQPFLDNYLKPNAAGTTPFRQALTDTKASTTADAYDNAVSATRNKSAAMGFSSTSQPVTFGAEAGIANSRAKAIADIPNQVNLEAQPVEFAAANMQQNQSGLYNALANTQQGQTNTLEQIQAQKDAQKAALAGGLANTAIGTAIPLIKSALTKTVTPPTPYAGTPINPGDPNFTGPVQQPAPVQADTNPVQNLPGSIGTVAGLGGAGIGAALAGTAAPAAALTPAVSVAIPELGIGGAAAAGSGAAAGGAAAGAGAAGADATAAGATAASSGSFGATLSALATNPITWGVAGAIAAALIWKHSQVHPTADKFVQNYQNPFAQHLGSVVDNFDKAFASGQMTKEQAQSAYDETAKLIDGFKQDMNAFSQKGGKENTVAHQAAATMAANFGPNWEGILGKMQSEIAGLQ